MRDNQYVFEVDMRANKIQIKDAIERIFDVDVLKVNTMVMPPKRGRRGRVSFTFASEPGRKPWLRFLQGQSITLV